MPLQQKSQFSTGKSYEEKNTKMLSPNTGRKTNFIGQPATSEQGGWLHKNMKSSTSPSRSRLRSNRLGDLTNMSTKFLFSIFISNFRLQFLSIIFVNNFCHQE